MVDRNIKESLNLIGMQVHRNQAVDTGSTQHVCDQLGPDRNTRFIFSILTCPTEIRNNCDYRVCWSTLGSIDHQEKLHQIIRVRKRWLYQEYIATANRLFIRDGKFTIGKVLNVHLSQRTTKTIANFLCKIPGVSSRKHQERSLCTHYSEYLS